MVLSIVNILDLELWQHFLVRFPGATVGVDQQEWHFRPQPGTSSEWDYTTQLPWLSSKNDHSTVNNAIRSVIPPTQFSPTRSLSMSNPVLIGSRSQQSSPLHWSVFHKEFHHNGGLFYQKYRHIYNPQTTGTRSLGYALSRFYSLWIFNEVDKICKKMHIWIILYDEQRRARVMRCP